MQRNAIMFVLIRLRAVTQYLKLLDNETHMIDQLKLKKYICFFCIPCEESVQLILHNNFMQGIVPVMAFFSVPPPAWVMS